MKLQYQEMENIIRRIFVFKKTGSETYDYEIIKNSKAFLGSLLDYCASDYKMECQIFARAYDDRIGDLIYECISQDKGNYIKTLSSINKYLLEDLGITGAWRYFFIKILTNVFNWECPYVISDFKKEDEDLYEEEVIEYQQSFNKDIFHILSHLIAADEKHVIAISQNGDVFATKEIENDDLWNDLIQVAVGEGHFAGLKKDHTVLDTFPQIQKKIKRWKNVIAIEAGKNFVVGLTKEKKVLFASTQDRDKKPTLKWTNIIDISAKENMILGADDKGKVHVAGIKGQSTINFSRSDIVKVIAGGNHAFVVYSDGTIECSGYIGKLDHGQCMVSDFKYITALSSNLFHTVAVDPSGNCMITPYSPANESDIKFHFGEIDNNSLTELLTVTTSSSFFVGLKKNGKLICGGNVDSIVRQKIARWSLFTSEEQYIDYFMKTYKSWGDEKNNEREQ